MKMKLLSYITALSVASCSVMPVMAQEDAATCGEFDDMMELVFGEWGESPLAMGLSLQGHIMQISINEQTGGWTTLLTDPATGYTCIADAGIELMKAKVKPNV